MLSKWRSMLLRAREHQRGGVPEDSGVCYGESSEVLQSGCNASPSQVPTPPGCHPPDVRGPLADYIRHMANCMGLMDWEFQLKWEYAKDDNVDEEDTTEVKARCKPLVGRRFAVLSFSSDVRLWDSYQLRHTVTHELVHAHLAGIQHMVENEAYEYLNKPYPWSTFWDLFQRNLELSVDAIAVSWARQLPMIDWSVDEFAGQSPSGDSPDPELVTHIEVGFPHGYSW